MIYSSYNKNEMYVKKIYYIKPRLTSLRTSQTDEVFLYKGDVQMAKFEDLTGQKFGRLTVIKRVENNRHSKAQWLCQCECGNETIVITSGLKSGNTKSCGCLKLERSKNINKTHGLSNTKLHKIWLVMRRRCNDKNFSRYKWYGAKGIKVCEEWNNTNDGFINFYNWATQNDYKDDLGLTIDRIDFRGDYKPENCRFVTFDIQANNKSNNHYITYNNKTQSLSKWCEELNLKYDTVKNRIYKGWTPEEAFETPIGGKRND